MPGSKIKTKWHKKEYIMNRRVKFYPRGRDLANTAIRFTLSSADESGMEISYSSMDKGIRRSLINAEIDRRGNVIHHFRCRGNDRANSILAHYRSIARRRRRAGLYHEDGTDGIDLHGAIASVARR